jgi:hypothetical protein
MDHIINADDFNLPNPSYVERSVNRLRQKLRPAEPKDLSFDVCSCSFNAIHCEKRSHYNENTEQETVAMH